jgi:hypothetical protein
MSHEIFSDEIADGLAFVIAEDRSIAYLSQLAPLDPDTALARSLTRATASEQITDPGLFFMQDILVTTGGNKNTDYFDRHFTWLARSTSEHKPLNFEHDEKRIIGHITTAQVVDEDFQPIDHSTAFEDLPDKFHILNGSVIYKVWADDEQSELIETTIAEIEAGEWFVSMECTFKGFDYVVTSPDGDKMVIARSSESAYLTKYLRQYGGPGFFTDKATGSEYKLERLLKNIAFSGKGLVRRPANPESVILSNTDTKQKSSSEEIATSPEVLGYVSDEIQLSLSSDEPEKNIMSETTDKVYQDRIVALEAEVKHLRDELSNASVQAAQASITSLEADVKAKATEIDQLNTQLTASKEAIDSLTKRAETAEANESKLKDELSKVEASQKRSERLATLISKGASQEQSESLVAKFENLTDEQFTSMVDVLSAAFKPFKKDDEDKEDDKKDKGKASDATQVIDNATVVEEPALAAASETPSPEATRIAVAKFLQPHLRYNSKVKID